MQELANELAQRIDSLGAVIGRCRKLKRDVTELERRREFLAQNLRLVKGGYKLPKSREKVKEEWWRRPVVLNLKVKR